MPQGAAFCFFLNKKCQRCFLKNDSISYLSPSFLFFWVSWLFQNQWLSMYMAYLFSFLFSLTLWIHLCFTFPCSSLILFLKQQHTAYISSASGKKAKSPGGWLIQNLCIEGPEEVLGLRVQGLRQVS